jgi:hypothetical protein
MNFTWNFIELFANGEKLISVRYLLTGIDGQNTVQSEGNHTFSDGIAFKPLTEIVESDLVQWIEKDTTQNDINPIKLAVENQLNALNNVKKVDFPWLAGTFTVE